MRHGAFILARPCTASPPAPVEAIAAANRALRLSPFDPVIFHAHLALGLAAIVGGAQRRGGFALRKGGAGQSSIRQSPFLSCRIARLGWTPRWKRRRSARRYMEMVPSARIAMLSEFGFASALNTISSLKACGSWACLNRFAGGKTFSGDPSPMAAATRWRSSTRRAYASDPLGDLSLAKTTEWTAAVRK